MDLLNELASGWDIKILAEEMDAVLAEYRNLIILSQLNEGVLDNLGDDIVQKVTEIQRRIEVIAKARNIVKRLSQTGGFSDADAKKHRERLTRNRKSLSAALKRTSRKMKEFEKAATKAIKTSAKSDEPNRPSSVSSDATDLRPFGRQAPFLLSQASKGAIDINNEDFEKYMDTFESLVESGLLSRDGKITPKGQASLDAHREKRGTVPSREPRRSAIDDLSDIGGNNDSDALQF